MNKLGQANSTNPTNYKKLPHTVVILGLVSFFNVFASDIVIPLIPILPVTVVVAGPGALDSLKASQTSWLVSSNYGQEDTLML